MPLPFPNGLATNRRLTPRADSSIRRSVRAQSRFVRHPLACSIASDHRERYLAGRMLQVAWARSTRLNRRNAIRTAPIRKAVARPLRAAGERRPRRALAFLRQFDLAPIGNAGIRATLTTRSRHETVPGCRRHLYFMARRTKIKTHKQDPAINRRRRGSNVSFNSVSSFGDVFLLFRPSHPDPLPHPRCRIGCCRRFFWHGKQRPCRSSRRF